MNDKLIKEIEQYAHANKIPIMQPDGIKYLCSYIKEHQVKTILEIGSAIGYSAIKMALVRPDIHIVTIEKDPERFQLAIKNVAQMRLHFQITVVSGDALEIKIPGHYDLIFIDASKGHNIDFFNLYKAHLKPNGVIITDNLSFHGLVEDPTLAITKNQKGIVKKIQNYITFLDHNDEFNTTYINVGDKIAISQRKENPHE